MHYIFWTWTKVSEDAREKKKEKKIFITVLRKPRNQKNKWPISWKTSRESASKGFSLVTLSNSIPALCLVVNLALLLFSLFNCAASPPKFWLGQKPRENTIAACQTSDKDTLQITIPNASFLRYVKWLDFHIFLMFLTNGHVTRNAPAWLSSWLVSQMSVLCLFVFTTSTGCTSSPTATLFNLTSFCLCGAGWILLHPFRNRCYRVCPALLHAVLFHSSLRTDCR